MKKTIKMLGFVVLFMGLMLLHSSVQAASNGIVVRNEKELNCVRTDSGNTTTLELKEGDYYQEADKLSANLKKALEGDSKKGLMDGWVYYYIPLPKDFETNYKTAKIYDLYNGKRTSDTPYNATYVDENFEQIPIGNDFNNPNTKGAKYIRLSSCVINTIGSDSVKRLTGCKKNSEILFYDKDGKETKFGEYAINLTPKFTYQLLKIQLINQKGQNYSTIYDGGNGIAPDSYSGMCSIEKGEQLTFKTSNNSTDEVLTNQSKFTVKDSDIVSVDKDGKMSAKKIGTTSVTIETKGISLTINVSVYPSTYFQNTITEEQINDLIEYAKLEGAGDIYYTTEKDTVVPAKLIKAAKDLKKAIHISTYEANNDKDYVGYYWELKPENITDTTKSMNVGVKRVDCFVDSLKDNKNVLFLDFQHSGALPGKVNVSIYAENAFDRIEGEAFLYYYNEETKKCEFVSKVTVNEYEEMVLTLDHCSRYVLASVEIDEALLTGNATTVVDNRKLDGEPKTGEASYVVLASVMAMISFVGIMIVKKHK